MKTPKQITGNPAAEHDSRLTWSEVWKFMESFAAQFRPSNKKDNENTEYLTCPFCKDTDFDKDGLKYHLQNYCETQIQSRTPMPKMEAKEYLTKKGVVFSTSPILHEQSIIEMSLPILTSLLTEFASLSKQTEWISVEKELPVGKFLALNRNQMDLQYVARYDKVHEVYKHTGGRFCGTKEVPYFTHWLPLPHPPKSNQ